MAPTEWKPIRTFEGIYEVSDLGLVRRVAPHRGYDHRGAGHILSTKSGPYARVELCNGPIRWRELVHRLVAGAFVPNPHGHSEINHIDGDKRNNRADNLEWVNHSQNMRHAHETGLKDERGERHPMSKLTADDVLAIRAEYDPPVVTLKALGDKYGVSESQISHIVRRMQWTHI